MSRQITVDEAVAFAAKDKAHVHADAVIDAPLRLPISAETIVRLHQSPAGPKLRYVAFGEPERVAVCSAGVALDRFGVRT